MCGSPVEGHGKRIYCSRKCLFKAGNLNKDPERVREYRRRSEARIRHSKVCQTCGTEFQAQLKKQKHCYSCRPKRAGNHRSQRKQLLVYTGPPFSPPVLHVRSSREWTAGTCQVCKAGFVSPYRDVTCSEPCRIEHQRRRHRTKYSRRRARILLGHAETVKAHVVFERDGWKCHLCHKRIGRAYKAPHPKSATIDHIIPLSLGGTHEYANVAAAHFICNVRKSNTGHGDQLALL